MKLNGTPVAVTRAVTRIACNVSQPGIGAEPRQPRVCDTPLDTKRHQRSSGAAKPPGRRQQHRRSLDPDGCLARFVRSHELKKRARSATAKGLVKKPAACAAMNSFTRLTRAG